MAASAFPSASKASGDSAAETATAAVISTRKRYVNERCAGEKQVPPLRFFISVADEEPPVGMTVPLNFAILLACITLVHHFDSSAIDQWFAICGAQGYLGLLGDALDFHLGQRGNDRGDVVTGEGTARHLEHIGLAVAIPAKRFAGDVECVRMLRGYDGYAHINIRKQRQILIVGDAGEFADVAGSKQVQGGRNNRYSALPRAARDSIPGDFDLLPGMEAAHIRFVDESAD